MIDTDENSELNTDNVQSQDDSAMAICKFRFVSGTYVGSSLDLIPEDYYIGNTSNCDIVCGTESEPTELKITITPNGQVIISLLQGKAFVDRQEIPLNESLELLPGQVLSIGTDALTWHNDWSTFSEKWLFMSEKELGELQQRITESVSKAEQNSESVEENASENDNSEQTSNDIEDSDAEDSSATNEDQQNIDSEKELVDGEATDKTDEVSKKSSSKSLMAVVTCIGVGILVGLIFLMNWGYKLDEEEAKSDELTLEEYVANYPDGQLSLVDRGYVTVIRGVLQDQEALNKFIEDMPKNEANRIELNVKLISDLQSYLNQTFASYGITVSSVYTKDGFEVFGYIHDPILEAEIVSKVESDFNGFAQVIPNLKYYKDIDDVLKEKVSEFGLKADYLFGKGLIAYNGNFSLENLDKLQSIRKDVINFVNGPVIFTPYDRLPLDEQKYIDTVYAKTKKKEQEQNNKDINRIDSKQDNKLSAKNEEAFSVKSIVGINLTPMSFITTKNGAKYFEGGKLPNGFIIKKIEKNAILVEKNNQVQRLEIK